MIFCRLLLTLGFAAAALATAAVDTRNLRAVFRSGAAVSGWESSLCKFLVSNVAENGRRINTMKLGVWAFKDTIATKLKCLIAEQTETEAVKNMVDDGKQLLEKWASKIPAELLEPIKDAVNTACKGKSGEELAKAAIDQLKGDTVRDAIYVACDVGKAASEVFATCTDPKKQLESLKKIVNVYDLLSLLNPGEVEEVKEVAQQALQQIQESFGEDIYAKTQEAIDQVEKAADVVSKIKSRIDAKAVNGKDEAEKNKLKVKAAPDIIADEVCRAMQKYLDEQKMKEEAKTGDEKKADKKKKTDENKLEKSALTAHKEKCTKKTYSKLVQAYCC